MRTLKLAALMFALTLLAGIAAPAAKADTSDWQTYLTFSKPVEVPGMVLVPGKYEFRLIDHAYTNGQAVGIFDSHGKLLETVLAIPDYRTHATGKTVLSFEKRDSGSPQAIREWFYPGGFAGVEFVYPQQAASPSSKGGK